ncbi:MAG: hemerythrin domain-containing protein [Actinobacteria bacterium]|nr:hemerythrin domain-containing protein [Micrococcales bacterium]MCB0903154.1 hemerythrin domain-containing protein [Actinomycetota bacterium]
MVSDAEHATEDVLDLLAEEHHEAEQMLEELSSQDKQEHDPRELADRLTASLVRHSVAEEMYVYPAMREHLEDGDAAVEHDISEHQELEELLKRLEGLEPGDEQWPEVVAALRETPADHVADEENDHFPRLRAEVPEDVLIDLRDKVEMAEQVAPTRPHPSAPHSELFHKIVGPGVGMVDRLRDALAGRMTG